jgi:hypothetical protein
MHPAKTSALPGRDVVETSGRTVRDRVEIRKDLTLYLLVPDRVDRFAKIRDSSFTTWIAMIHGQQALDTAREQKVFQS